MNKGNVFRRMALFLALSLVLGAATLASASPAKDAEPTKVVIQVTTDDAQVQKMLFSNIANLQREMGVENLMIEVVAYGPGLGLVTRDSDFQKQVEALSDTVRFSACENTMAAIAKRTGKKPELADGVVVVPSGIARVVQLQQQGYLYITPE